MGSSADRIECAWQRYERAPQSLKDIAASRLAAVQAVNQLCAGGMPLLTARANVVAQLRTNSAKGASLSSLGRWAALVAGAEQQHYLALLLPGYVGRVATAEIPALAWDVFKADYLRLEAPTATSCYDRLARRAKVEGWQLPSLRAFTNKLAREVPLPVQRLARNGSGALDLMFPAQERDRSVFTAMQAVNADGHRFDVFVKLPTGQIGRPVIVAVQDLYSGKLLGWRLGETENADLARLAFGDVIERFGVMSDAWLDNGRSFASKMLTGGASTRFRFKIKKEDPTGLLVALGVNIHWTTPYHGQAKPIERAWRDLCDRVATHSAFAGAYTGNRPDAKPENYGSKAVEWDTFARVVAEEIAAHNARPGRRSKVCNGRSFDDVFNSSYSKCVIKRASKAQLREFMLAAERVTAHARDGSVRLSGNRYWSEDLANYCGQKLTVRFDPDALHASVAVYRMNGAFIGDAKCVAAVGFSDTNAARDHAKAKQQWRRAARQQLNAEVRMDITHVASQLPAPPECVIPSAGVIRPLFGRPVDQDTKRRPVNQDAQEARERKFQALMLSMQPRRNVSPDGDGGA